MTNKSAWAWWIVGALLTLAWKLARYIYAQKKLGYSLKVSLLEWFFEDSAENAVSWITTIGAVWVLGATYIDRLTIYEVSVPLPLHNSLAFFLGGLAEFIAPNITKWITRKLSDKFGA
jgi:hypothetical protein